MDAALQPRESTQGINIVPVATIAAGNEQLQCGALVQAAFDYWQLLGKHKMSLASSSSPLFHLPTHSGFDGRGRVNVCPALKQVGVQLKCPTHSTVN